MKLCNLHCFVKSKYPVVWGLIRARIICSDLRWGLIGLILKVGTSKIYGYRLCLESQIFKAMDHWKVVAVVVRFLVEYTG